MHHAKPTLRQRWRALPRRRKALVAAPVALLALAGVAAAAMFWLGLFDGRIGVVAAPHADVKFTAASKVSTTGELTCNPQVAGGKLDPKITGALPGSSCTIDATVTVTHNQGEASPVRLQDVSYSNAIPTAIELADCGTQFASGVPQTVRLRFMIPEDATPGDKTPASGAGLKVVRAQDYVSAACNSFT